MPAYPGIPQWSTNLTRHCQSSLYAASRRTERSVFLCMERLFLLTSPLPPRTEGSLWLFAGGRVGLTAESWPSDKASSLQALTGNGARADALGWLARPELGRARPGAGWRPHRDGEWESEQGNSGGGGVGSAKDSCSVSGPPFVAGARNYNLDRSHSFYHQSQTIWQRWLDSFQT